MGEPRRPSPEELLQRYGSAMRGETRGRGALRVYLGAAPGVGKTYAMLNEGRRLKTEGRDVVVGFVETHGRAETEAQVGELEVVPRLQIPYRGITVEEMDTEAVIARKPEIALVDELAHTNVPGSPRAKRHEDVALLRAAGIAVITTLNVQHLASIHDIVAGITGVEVRELVPDRVLEEATEIQLVDLPVELLRERLAQGKIYPPERAEQALARFFDEGNLTALRELALRRTAAGVDDRLTGFMLGGEGDPLQTATERVVVLVEDHPRWGNVLRNGWRIASALHADLVALAVTEGGAFEELPTDRGTIDERHAQLVEDLGASLVVVAGETVSEAVIAAVTAQRATVLVVGYQPRSPWRRLFAPSLIDDVLSRVDGVDCYLVRL